MAKLVASTLRKCCLLGLLYAGICSANGAVLYVNSSTGDDGNSGLSWGMATKNIQAAIDVASSGDEVWAAAGTYTLPTGAQAISDRFEERNANAVDILGMELDVSYTPPGAQNKINIHTTMLHIMADVYSVPPFVIGGTSDNTLGQRLGVTLQNQSHDLLIFANHPSLLVSGYVTPKEDLAEAANANAIHGIEIKIADDAQKWDYALYNLDDQAGACQKIVWGLNAEDMHWATRVANMGRIVGSIPTADKDPVYSKDNPDGGRLFAFEDMIRRGTFFFQPNGNQCDIPTYELLPNGRLRVTIKASEVFWRTTGSAYLRFYGGWDSANNRALSLYTATVPLGQTTVVEYQPPDPASIRYIRPILALDNTSPGYPAQAVYFQPVRYRSDGSWWTGPYYNLHLQTDPLTPAGPSPYPADRTGEVITYFNTHAHTLVSDGDAAPPDMRRLYWERYGPGTQPRFSIITDHNIFTVFTAPVASVVTLKEGVHLYGGFAGNETQRSQRDWLAHPTILDGQDANRCVYADGAAWGVKTNATLDGFVIQNGKAANSCGGGAYLINCSPKIANCTFGDLVGQTDRYNLARYGGAISISASSPVIEDCIFRDNRSQSIQDTQGSGGGGMHTDAGSTAWVTRCLFEGNQALCRDGTGGGLLISGASPTIISCAFIGNKAERWGFWAGGGGIAIRRADIPPPAIINCTIVGNKASSRAGGIAIIHESYASISNCIVAFNDYGIQTDYTPERTTLRNNDFFGNMKSGQLKNYIGLSPGVGDMDPPQDPLFVSQFLGDYHLYRYSPCIDVGYDQAVSSWNGIFDLDGNERRRGVHVDMGAYENQLSLTIYEAKSLAQGSVISTGVISAAWQDCFYVQSTNRSAGIRVEVANHGGNVGDMVTFSGTVHTNLDGERYIEPDAGSLSYDRIGAQVRPLEMSERSLGGDTVGLQQGVVGAVGLNNIGLLVSTAGEVTYAGTGYFYIDDGSCLKDPSTHKGVKITAVGLTIPGKYTYVKVAGISSCYASGGELYRLLRPRNQLDIVTY